MEFVEIIMSGAKMVGALAVGLLAMGTAYLVGAGRKDDPGALIIKRKSAKNSTPWGKALLAFLPETPRNDAHVFQPYDPGDNPATVADGLDVFKRVTGAIGGAGGSNAAILDVIGQAEAPQGYDQVYGGISRNHQPPRPITTMTVNEVLAWQDSIDPYHPSEAAGRYQVMEDTLRGLVNSGQVNGNARYDERTQDGIATLLMERRGLSDYKAGRITAEKFGNSLAKEWAGLPVITGRKAGRSHYAGDGLNHSQTSINTVLAALQGIV